MTLIFVFTILALGFLSGQTLRYFYPSHTAFFRDIAVYIGLRIAIPFSIFGSIWALTLNNGALAILPIIGASILLVGLLLGIVIARIQKCTLQQRGVIAPAGAYTNIGAIGGFVVFSHLGEQGFALVPLYKLFEELIYFGLLFPYAAKHSQEKTFAIKKWWQDPIIRIMSIALLSGLALNLNDFPRPTFIENALGYTIPFGSFCLMLSIGIIFQTHRFKEKARLALPIVLLKPVVLLLIAIALINILNIKSLPSSDVIIDVCLILAVMPTAFIVSLPASLYKLDTDLANTIWVLSTALLIPTLLLIPYITHL